MMAAVMRVVAAARAQGRQTAFVVAPREPERILRQRGMTDFRFRQEGHATPDSVAAEWLRACGSWVRLGQHTLDDELGGDRQSAVVQQRTQLCLLHARLEREQRAHLRVAVLLDHEHQLLLLEEFLHFVAERERAQAHVVSLDAVVRKDVERLAHRAIGAAVGHHRDVDVRVLLDDGLRHQPLRRGELAREPVEHDLVFGGIFGVHAVLRVAGAAREVRALRMHAGQRAIRECRRRPRRDSDGISRAWRSRPCRSTLPRSGT